MPLIMLATFTVPLSVSGTAVSLGGIAHDLGASSTGQQWALNGFNLTFACSTLIWGSVADAVGRWRALLIGLLIFGVGSAVSLFATGYVQLDAARILAGAGAGAVFSVGSAVVSTSLGQDKRTQAFAMLGAVAGLSLAFGPSLCGLLTQVINWRAVYGLQLACLLIVCVGMPMIRHAVVREERRAVRFDLLGAVLFCVATSLTLGGLVLGSATGWLSVPFLACTVAGVVGYVLFFRRQAVAPNPLLALGTLRNRRFTGITMVVVVASFTFTNAVTYLPVFFQGAFGLSAGGSGAFVMFLTLPVLVFPLLAGRLFMRGVSLETILVWSIATMVVGLVLAAVGALFGLAWMAVPMIAVGAGFGLQAGLVDGEALKQVPPSEAGMGAGWLNTVRLGTEAIAVSLFGSLFASFVGDTGHGSSGGLAVITISSTLVAGVVGLFSVAVLYRNRRATAAAVEGVPA
jgi:MFS family permease